MTQRLAEHEKKGRKGGPIPDPLREAVAIRYRLTRKQRDRLSRTLLVQLAGCKDEASRRLLLGCSR